MSALDNSVRTLSAPSVKSLKLSVAQRCVPAVRWWIRYSAAPFGRHWLWRKFAWLPVTFQAKTRFGFRFGGDTRDMVPQYVYYFGVWEPMLSEFVRRRLRSGDTFVDIGSNVGYYSVLAAHIVGPTGLVVSLDASKEMGDRLMENSKLNDIGFIHFVNGAVSDHEGEVVLYPGTTGNSGQASIVSPAGPASDGTLVRVAPLAGWIKPHIVERARLIKIDIEGAEGLMIRGSRDLLSRLNEDCEVIMEINPAASAASGVTAGDILLWMEHAGFRAYQIDNRYDYAFYERPVRRAPLQRIRLPPDRAVDVIFSRADAEELRW